MRLTSSVITASALVILAVACGGATGGPADAPGGTPVSDATAPSASVTRCGLRIATDQSSPDVAELEALFGDLPDRADDAADCFADAVEAGRPAVFHTVHVTVEGDPILETVRVDQEAVIEVTTDSTHDEFGSGGVTTRRFECGWDRRTGQPAPCDQ